MYVFLPPPTASFATCALTLPPYLQICSPMVFTDIISDVLELLTPTLIPTCKSTYAQALHTSTFIHANPRSPPHTRTRTPPYLVYPFPIYLPLPPYIPVYAHLTTSTHIHLHAHTHPPPPPPSIFILGLLFHSDFSYLTRLCPLYEPGVLGHSLPTGSVIQPQS